MKDSLFSGVELAAWDPILGLNVAFARDERARKGNLGVGVYFTEAGTITVLCAVGAADRQRAAQPGARGYLPIEGTPAYDAAVQQMLFGPQSTLVQQGRATTAQALGGTGGLRVGAELLQRVSPSAVVAISDPSWENHRAIFESSGFRVVTYPYYEPGIRGVDFGAMAAALRALPPRSIVVLHACCHNPTGADLTPGQWREVLEIVRGGDLVP